MHSELIAIASVIVLGIGAQWLAWRIRIPSILLLLIVGFLAGATGFLDPDEHFGSLLLPSVSLAVGLILFEGGLSLQFRELRDVAGVVGRLVSIGAAVTWVIGTIAAATILGLPRGVSLLLGAILVVTGPTVIGPMLQHIRPTGPAGRVVKWEGIVIDPIGAVLAVLVFEVMLSGTLAQATREVMESIAITGLGGGAIGVGAGFLLAVLLRNYWIPDALENPVSLMFVVAAYAGAELIHHEAGLVATTVMGVTLANQRLVDVKHIVEFKENLRVLLISSLFIVLAARLDVSVLTSLSLREVAFIAVLVLVARPASVLISTLGSSLGRADKLFIAWMAPRGIVAAAVSSVFALRLREHGGFDPAVVEAIVPVTFLVIVATVLVYGLTAPEVARRLGLAVPDPQGVLFIGAHPWARALAELLHKHGIRITMVDTNRDNVAAARMAGLGTYGRSILGEHALNEIDLGGLGRLLCVTANDLVNVLTVQRFASIFGRANVYQLPRAGSEPDGHQGLSGRVAFGEDCTYRRINRRFNDGAVFKATPLTPEFTMDDWREEHGDDALVIASIGEDGKLTISTAQNPLEPKPGDTVVGLVGET